MFGVGCCHGGGMQRLSRSRATTKANEHANVFYYVSEVIAMYYYPLGSGAIYYSQVGSVGGHHYKRDYKFLLAFYIGSDLRCV
jgi:hypothetical protein